jgi:toxin ParE1/3/4
MPSDDYRLTPRAFADLDDIWRFTAENWSLEQADHYINELTELFRAITAMPTLARERPEFDPPVRIHTHGSHVIVYTAADHVVILRLLGARQDWRSILKAIDL